MERREWLSILATAPPERLLTLAEPFSRPVETLRAPEIGSVMVRGRAGGTGAAFNLGEMTVTRASVQLGDAVGHGHVQGRSRPAAEAAALLDALLQGDEAGAIQRDVLAPLQRERAEARRLRAAKAEATKVNFFTLVRGEVE
ncbi:phosphonate C-P lyase system protein PhnG [Roseobacter sp. HKCCA0434]|uniref:phosphonate C-P lyase system protein PhnG n=1 Tax=Roseobacter sp. HKCCA0434 TaxID=3079297 RepID=UPI002905CFE9|nr:phosphonate C-P lyase system protein PhnG [Roseobacter sp. HKCCA0434]